MQSPTTTFGQFLRDPSNPEAFTLTEAVAIAGDVKRTTQLRRNLAPKKSSKKGFHVSEWHQTVSPMPSPVDTEHIGDEMPFDDPYHYPSKGSKKGSSGKGSKSSKKGSKKSTGESTMYPHLAPTPSASPSISLVPSISSAPSGICDDQPLNIVSFFEESSDGWMTTDFDDSSPETSFVAMNGNPGGHLLSLEDNRLLGTRYFQAPAKFLGNFSESHGLFLRFDIQVLSETDPNGLNRLDDPFDVQLFTNINDEDGNSTQIFMTLRDLDPIPSSTNGQWESYALVLDTSLPWKQDVNPDDNAPLTTEEEIRTILSDLSGLAIRAEYTTNEDETTGLDNVILETTCGAVPTMIIR